MSICFSLCEKGLQMEPIKYCHVMYVRYALFNCCPGNLGMCVLCENSENFYDPILREGSFT